MCYPLFKATKKNFLSTVNQCDPPKRCNALKPWGWSTMHDTWIKLYRKAMEHPVFFDETAWRVWTWILMSVDYETGEMELGRFVASRDLRMNPNTFKSVID